MPLAGGRHTECACYGDRPGEQQGRTPESPVRERLGGGHGIAQAGELHGRLVGPLLMSVSGLSPRWNGTGGLAPAGPAGGAPSATAGINSTPVQRPTATILAACRISSFLPVGCREATSAYSSRGTGPGKQENIQALTPSADML